MCAPGARTELEDVAEAYLLGWMMVWCRRPAVEEIHARLLMSPILSPHLSDQTSDSLLTLTSELQLPVWSKPTLLLINLTRLTFYSLVIPTIGAECDKARFLPASYPWQSYGTRLLAQISLNISPRDAWSRLKIHAWPPFTPSATARCGKDLCQLPRP